MPNSAWAEDRDRKRRERQQRQLDRAMASAPSRQEIFTQSTSLFNHVSSVALAVEALETLLISKGILRDNELMETLEALVKTKAEQAQAVAAQQDESGVILAS